MAPQKGENSNPVVHPYEFSEKRLKIVGILKAQWATTWKNSSMKAEDEHISNRGHSQRQTPSQTWLKGLEPRLLRKLRKQNEKFEARLSNRHKERGGGRQVLASWAFYSEFLNYNAFLYVFIYFVSPCVRIPAYAPGVHLARGQPVGVRPLFPPCGSWRFELRTSGLAASTLTQWAISLALEFLCISLFLWLQNKKRHINAPSKFSCIYTPWSLQAGLQVKH